MMAAEKKGISAFSVLLLAAVASVVGMACFSMLKVQYAPSSPGDSISVQYSYPGASSRIVEAEVTSRIEGALSTIREAAGVKSVSRDGGGSVTLDVRKGSDMEAVRFEVASQIRNIYATLPDGCTYPSISLGTNGAKSTTAITYVIKSPLPSKEIAHYVEDYLMYPVSVVEGVSSVSFSGNTGYELVITFDARQAEAAGISADEIAGAFNLWYADDMLGMAKSGGNSFSVRMRSPGSAGKMPDLDAIPVKNVNGRIVHLGEIATARYQEALPRSYYRINGLNTLNLAVEVSSDANLIAVVKEVKKVVADVAATLPEEIGVSVSYDYSEYISAELDKIYLRTLLCLLILIVFVLVMNRSWRYSLVVVLTLAVNLLLSVTVYYLSGLHIHVYTLAGITVSLGIIIDNCIVMVDHYSRHGSRSVFPALLSAVLTTVSALLVVLLLPESEKASLIDFSYVIIINLVVSLLVAYLFVPALLDVFPVHFSGSGKRHHRKLKRIAAWNRLYERYIKWGTVHRWVYVAVSVAAFGIPTVLLPKEFGDEKRAPLKTYEKVLNKVVGWAPYARNKATVDRILGSSFALFNRSISRFDFYREPERPSISISAGMPEGCTVQQLDEVMRHMENYLAHFEEIDVFETSIRSAGRGSITVHFKPEVENTFVPAQIKSDIITMATNFGGANWTVSGIDQTYFNNNIVSSVRMHSITLSGYNYDALLDYAQTLVEHISGNRRVNNPEIWGSEWSDRPVTEYGISYDREALTTLGVSPYEYYETLRSPLYSSGIGSIEIGDGYVPVRLVSSDAEEFDIWHMDNVAVKSGDARVKLSGIGSIRKSLSGLAIRKEEQAYAVTVRFDFIGTGELARRFIKAEVDYMNRDVLPLGFMAKDMSQGWFYDNQDKYAGLILLVVLCIFVILAVQFNSLRYPFSIIYLIPISFIGLFLTYGLSDFTFDKGGFAAFIMLSGITVNAGIYLIHAWIGEDRTLSARSYTRAFNRKVQPIMLTILSTVLGLIPFLFDGPSEVFWFCFAVGTISGLIFSIIALIFFLPVFAVKKDV